MNPNLIDLHVRMLRRSGKKSCLNVTHDRWEKALVRVCKMFTIIFTISVVGPPYHACLENGKMGKGFLTC